MVSAELLLPLRKSGIDMWSGRQWIHVLQRLWWIPRKPNRYKRTTTNSSKGSSLVSTVVKGRSWLLTTFCNILGEREVEMILIIYGVAPPPFLGKNWHYIHCVGILYTTYRHSNSSYANNISCRENSVTIRWRQIVYLVSNWPGQM